MENRATLRLMISLYVCLRELMMNRSPFAMAGKEL